MKKLVLLLTLMSMFVITPVFAAEESLTEKSLTFVGVFFGLGYLTNADDETAINNSGAVGGLTARHFFKNRIGIGATFFSEIHQDDSSIPGDWESTINAGTIDLLFGSESPNKNSLSYLMLSAGRGIETAEEANSGFTMEINSDLWGIGIGAIRYSLRGFGIGGEIKYLSAVDSANADGIFQAYFSLGFVF